MSQQVFSSRFIFYLGEWLTLSFHKFSNDKNELIKTFLSHFWTNPNENWIPPEFSNWSFEALCPDLPLYMWIFPGPEQNLASLTISQETQNLSRIHTYPKVFGFKIGNARMWSTNLMQIIEKRIQFVETTDALVKCFHHFIRMFAQLLGWCLLLFGFQFTEFIE